MFAVFVVWAPSSSDEKNWGGGKKGFSDCGDSDPRTLFREAAEERRGGGGGEGEGMGSEGLVLVHGIWAVAFMAVPFWAADIVMEV